MRSDDTDYYDIDGNKVCDPNGDNFRIDSDIESNVVNTINETDKQNMFFLEKLEYFFYYPLLIINRLFSYFINLRYP